MEEDPAHAFAMEMGLDFLDFCTEQLENEMSRTDDDDLDMEEFDVSWAWQIDDIKLTKLSVTDF